MAGGRLAGDPVGLGAAGVVFGTAAAALALPWAALALAGALLTLWLGRAGLAFLACAVACCATFPLRTSGSFTPVPDPGSGVRDVLLAPLLATVPGDAGALAAGLALGDASHFTPAFRAAMRESATTHLVALSGFNVALILGTSRRALRRFLRPRQVALCGFGLLAVLLALAGLQPSLVRAALCGGAILLASTLGRRVGHARLLALAAAAMLAAFPAYALHLGFTLSFAASWALLATVGNVEHFLISGAGSLRAIAVRGILPSAVAQAGVAPVLLAGVGSLSLVGFAANPLALPLVPAITAASLAQLALAWVAPGLASLFGLLLAGLAAPVLAVVRVAALAPLSLSLPVPALGAVALFAAWFLGTVWRKPHLW